MAGHPAAPQGTQPCAGMTIKRRPSNFSLQGGAPRSGRKIIFPACRNPVLSRVMGAAAHDAAPEPITEDTMKYMLLIYRNEADMQAASKAQSEQTMGAYMAYTEALKKAGVYAGGDRLQPSSAATTVRVADGKSKVLDGPYAESKE